MVSRRKLVAACLGLSLGISGSAHASAWLEEGFSWELPWYASQPAVNGGGMLGVYDDTGDSIGTGASDADVSGSLVRLLWRDLEPTRGNYDFSRLDTALDALNGKPVLIRLEVNSRCHAPSWTEETIPYSKETTSFNFWAPEYGSHLKGLIDAFAERYRANDQIVGVHLGIGDGEYKNGQCPGNDRDKLFDGYGRAGWGEFYWTEDEEDVYETGNSSLGGKNNLNEADFENSVKNLIDIYSNAFGVYAGKLAWMSFERFGTEKYFDEQDRIYRYAQSKGLGQRDGEIESWMRYTGNLYGVNLVNSHNNDGSCSMRFDEDYADAIQGRYWGDENEFYGDRGYIIDEVGPLANQTYRFYVSSMRALQMRKKYFSINKEGHEYLRDTNDEFNSGAFLPYLQKTLGRTRSDTPDAFVLLGERTIDVDSKLYAPEYKNNPQEACLQQANARGYTLVSEFGRWLKIVSKTTADTSVIALMPEDEKNWGQENIHKRPNENNTPPVSEDFELYARKANAIYVDINDQLIQERCPDSCKIRIYAVFKDDHDMVLKAVPEYGTTNTVSTYGDGNIRTAVFSTHNFSGGGDNADFHIKTTDGSDVSVLMIRVTFEDSMPVGPAILDVPKTISPDHGTETQSSAMLSWHHTGAPFYRVSHEHTSIANSYRAHENLDADSLGCSSGVCRYEISGLYGGDNEWWVRSVDASGNRSDSSDTSEFTVVPPKTPVATWPTNATDVVGSTAIVYWWPTNGALSYKVDRGQESTGLYVPMTPALSASALHCDTGFCWHEFTNLPSGVNQWWITAQSTAGDSPSTGANEFTVQQ